MSQKIDFAVHGAIRVEYRVCIGAILERGAAQNIEAETRLAAGAGLIEAVALAKWGASVHLSGNPIGDDAHGRFILKELERFPGVQLETQIQSDLETPYSIRIESPNGLEAILRRHHQQNEEEAVGEAARKWAQFHRLPEPERYGKAAQSLFEARFGGLEAIPDFAEIEAALNLKH